MEPLGGVARSLMQHIFAADPLFQASVVQVQIICASHMSRIVIID